MASFRREYSNLCNCGHYEKIYYVESKINFNQIHWDSLKHIKPVASINTYRICAAALYSVRNSSTHDQVTKLHAFIFIPKFGSRKSFNEDFLHHTKKILNVFSCSSLTNFRCLLLLVFSLCSKFAFIIRISKEFVNQI